MQQFPTAALREREAGSPRHRNRMMMMIKIDSLNTNATALARPWVAMAFPETLHVLAEWAVALAAGAALNAVKKRVERNPAYNWKYQVRHIAGSLPWSFAIAPAAPLEFPDDASQRAFARRQAREKRDDAVDRMGYELLQQPADVAASVVAIIERVPLMPVGSAQRSGEGMVRRDKFTADVERVAGTSFFDGWPMLNGASVGKFLEAIDHGKDGVIAKLREAMSSGSDYDPDAPEDYGNMTGLWINQHIKRAGGIAAVHAALLATPGEDEITRAARVAGAFGLKPGGVELLIFVICVVVISGDSAMVAELHSVNGVLFLHGCHMRSWYVVLWLLMHPALGLYDAGAKGTVNDSKWRYGITPPLIQSLHILATLVARPSTIADHLCYYARGAMRRAFGAALDLILLANYGVYGFVVVRARLAEPTGKELAKLGRRGADGHANDAACFCIVKNRYREGLYDLYQNRVHQGQVGLLYGYTYAALALIVVDCELLESVAREPPPAWPPGAWQQMRDRGAFYRGTGHRAKHLAFVEKVNASPLVAAYPGIDLFDIFGLHELIPTRARVAACDALTPSPAHENMPYSTDTPFGESVMKNRAIALRNNRKNERKRRRDELETGA